MAELMGTGEAARRSGAGDLGFAALSAGVALMERRSLAVAQHWRTLAAVREASELPMVGYDYLTRLVEDYSAAMAAAWSPITPGAPPPGEQAPVAEPRAPDAPSRAA